MIDKNGDTVDMFPLFSTVETVNPQTNGNSPNNDDNDTNRVIGQVAERTETTSESSSDAEGNLESRTEPSNSFTMPIVICGVMLVGAATVLLVIYKKKK